MKKMKMKDINDEKNDELNDETDDEKIKRLGEKNEWWWRNEGNSR